MYIYIYIYSNSIRPKKKKKNTFNSEHLNFPGKELNVIDITEQ